MKALVLNRLRIGRNIEVALPFCLTTTLELGKIYHVKGQNGVGKTTLLRTISGYIPALSGDIIWQDKNISPACLSEISCYFGHDNALKTGLTAQKYLDYCFNLFKNTKDINLLIAYFKFQKLLDIPIHFLSCGQKKRLSLIAILCCNREIYCLDEASSGLDAEYRLILYSYLQEILLKQNKLIIITDHHQTPITDIIPVILKDTETL